VISPAFHLRISGVPGTALVVEPECHERIFMASTLMSLGLRVTATDNFKRAQSLVVAQPPTVLVAEIRLGAYNGLHLALLGRSMRPHMAQLLMSRFHDEVLQRDTDALGATFLRKPMTTEQLIGALYRTVFQDPKADGTVAPARPRLESPQGERRQVAVARPEQARVHRKGRTDTFPYLRAWRRPVS
jgi:DNA-binding NtrC family response regulator